MRQKAIEWLNKKIADDTTKAELDIIEFIKKCVKEFTPKKVDREKEDYINELFNKFYGVYPRKGSKEQARKTFRKKLVKLKTNEEILEKARKMAKLLSFQGRKWKEDNTSKQYIPLCSTFLNSNVPDKE